jgi:hypothetical protein
LEKFIVQEYPEYTGQFYEIITSKAIKVLNKWINELEIDRTQLEIILTDGIKIKYP